jgi:S-formylglutathione hydrolase
MGGHGALTLAMKYSGTFKSVSAFSPICNPSRVPWGIKAFSGYLGEDNKEAWKAHDATELAKLYEGPALDILMDTGTGDEFLEVQLHPQALESAAEANANLRLESNMRDGYDHSYFFIATFVEDHVRFHAQKLNSAA